MEERILTKVYGELHELLGDHREFKRETLARLSVLESEVKNLPTLRLSRIATIIGAVASSIAVATALGFVKGGL